MAGTKEYRYLAKENVNKKQLRIALIASEYTVREFSDFLELLLGGLATEYVAALLVCPHGCDSDSIPAGGAEVIHQPALDLPFTEPLAARLLAQQIAKFEPTVLHCLCESKASLTRRLAHRLDLPYVLTVNSIQGRWSQLSISSKRCRKIIVPGETINANLAKTHPGHAERIEKINIGTFVTETDGCFSHPDRIPTMVIAHPLERVEDFENLFGALRHLRVDGYEFMVVMAGDGRGEGQIWQLLTALDLLHTVTMVSRLKPWKSVLAAGDIFIRPQPRFVFDTSVLEAMSVGTAVAGCTGGVDDLIIEEKTAVLFKPEEELNIMRTLQKLLDRREFARQIAHSAQQHLKENYSVGDMISTTTEVYRKALG